MTAIEAPLPPAAAYCELVDAPEALDDEHPDCEPASAEVPLRLVHPDDGRAVVTWSDMPRCLVEEMPARGCRPVP